MSDVAQPVAQQQSIDDFKQVAEDMLKLAKAKGASQADVGAGAQTGLSASVRMGEVDTVEFHRDKGISITVYFGQRKGVATTTDTSAKSIASTVQAACDIAKYTTEDEYAGLADAELMAYDYPDLQLDHPWDVNSQEAIELARQCEQHARQQDKRITNSEGASVSTHQGIHVFANSHGFVGGYRGTKHSLSCVLIAEQNNEMQRDYWYTTSRKAQQLESYQQVAKTAAQRTLQRLGARKIKTASVPVIYAAEVAGGLLASFISAISGGSLYRKTSFLLDHLGKAVFPNFVRINEQPHLLSAVGSAAFDAEGVATQARDIVDAGVLQGYVLGSYSARKLGMKTTGNAGGVHNLTISANAGDLKALLQQMNTGLLVTELMGQGVNIVTGDYSRGATGFWVENGQIQYPVHEVTIAGNLREMYQDLVAVGSDIDTRGNIQSGSWLIKKMMVAGV